MDAFTELAKKHSLTLIEDCAQACGAKWKEKPVGSFGDFGAFSFYPTKNLGAYGDGGAITVRSKEQYAKLRSLRFYGKTDGGACTEFGVNSRLDELHASMLRVKLRHLDDWNAKRETLANLYRKLIRSSQITVPTATKKGTHSYHLFVVRSANRDEAQKRLALAGIGTLIHYPIPLSEQPFFKQFARGEFSNAKRFSREIFSLPLYPFLQEEEVRYIAETLDSVS
jgi:dTDP-4-amino-4,6-dideoxygalactose transaminase